MQPGSKAHEVHVVKGTLAFNCVKLHNHYWSTDCTGNLIMKVQKLTSAQMKIQAIISDVISPYAIMTVTGIHGRHPFLWSAHRCKQSSCIKNFLSLESLF